jgi:predicted SAM-dependent methyltransferase
MKTRNDKILAHVDLQGMGVEIGPVFNPILPKRAGFKTHVIDHANREQLYEKYRNHSSHLDQIEEVDFVWKGERYQDLTGKSHFYDWVIASHVIEHTPDLIGFLLDCDSILKHSGVISLVIPDKRYCFDRFRPISSLAHVIDAHLHRHTRHSPGTLAEYYLNVVSQNGNIIWKHDSIGNFHFIHSLQMAQDAMQQDLESGEYQDAHAWCFSPSSFRLLIHDLFQLGLVPLQEVDFFPTVGSEFYITLARSGKGVPLSRMDLLQRLEVELNGAILLKG